MCGIAGIFNCRDYLPIDGLQLQRMADSLAHRGPDDEGMWVSGHVGFAHRRLSIIDLAGGHQPMTNEDGSIWIVFNGEIYNHRELRPILEARGHRYQTSSDTETILHAYEEYGTKCVERLRGMFAFAIWDSRRNELFLARDRFGIKPLYYLFTDRGVLYFASEIKSVLAGGAAAAELNHRALPDYLANRSTSGPATLFRKIKRLLPGHTLLLRDGEVSIDRYWDLHFAGPDEPAKTEGQAVGEWMEAFRGSVSAHLTSDVPVGLFLSGGIDSSAIAAVMSRMVDAPIKTFSVAFSARDADESKYARLVAQAYGTEHHEVVISPEQFFHALPRLVWHEDEPLAGPASVPLYFVSELAARHVKVVLTGEGSDELLAGYERYRKTIYNIALGRLYSNLTNEPLRDAVRRGLHRMSPGSALRQKLARTFLCLPIDITSIYFDNFAVFPGTMQRDLFTPEAMEQIGTLDPYDQIYPYLDQADAGTTLDRLLYVDIKTYLHELLMKQDQMSMAASIESRVPFLDHHLAELTARLPGSMKLHGWETKYVLRRAMAGVLPEPILKRPKMGFPVPVDTWLRGPFRWVVDEYVLSERAMERRLFNAAFVRALVEEHRAGIRRHWERLWALINLEIWLRQFVDGDRLCGSSHPQRARMGVP